ncbi:hypothetical protein DdX_17472 [Ditylenchus destructor]|uniref:Uncharacterized protein n=1 Tax=Ditylenchus destructor TaxID=166010 RepID=A0AAD4QTE2_9BILA|nr:hypothetical protein DdX_17472 [Ditylenchus destructor]
MYLAIVTALLCTNLVYSAQETEEAKFIHQNLDIPHPKVTSLETAKFNAESFTGAAIVFLRIISIANGKVYFDGVELNRLCDSRDVNKRKLIGTVLVPIQNIFYRVFKKHNRNDDDELKMTVITCEELKYVIALGDLILNNLRNPFPEEQTELKAEYEKKEQHESYDKKMLKRLINGTFKEQKELMEEKMTELNNFKKNNCET